MIRIATSMAARRPGVVVGKAAVSTMASKTSSSMLRRVANAQRPSASRNFTFSFAGPRKLDDIIKRDTLEMKSTKEIEDIWLTYHESKEGVTGLILEGDQGPKVLERATDCPFIVQPVFRDDGFFNMISQFQKPCYFLMAYLEDYNMDPTAASPLLTFSVFDDFVQTKHVSLVRVDILNSNILDAEANKVVQSVLHNYIHEFDSVKTFNKRPKDFDFDDFVSRMSARWKEDDATVIDPSAAEPGKN